MSTTDLNNRFIYDKCRNSSTFIIDLQLTKSLDPSPNSNVTSFWFWNSSNTLEVFYRLRPTKYKHKDYITVIATVIANGLFLTNLNNMCVY
jgi:hypothetical protein